MLRTPCASRGHLGRRAVQVPHVRAHLYGSSVSAAGAGVPVAVSSIELESEHASGNGVREVTMRQSAPSGRTVARWRKGSTWGIKTRGRHAGSSKRPAVRGRGINKREGIQELW